MLPPAVVQESLNDQFMDLFPIPGLHSEANAT